ncbi:hypothetical protein SAMN05216223_109271 [Actinacidiphila yanglinensis]|uniref:DUF3558 domain-containing protein n=1 Tax=Actinacidiphila yanglinensis TaxID=310779 RepID=A0A1H6CP06_9ACTN|nr:hypothetical protein [Actinacidiphila yanglinensis]SEG74722.1 hypothetical protein SAMN05216223_109271 [Actinacidiphila yanglinensis]
MITEPEASWDTGDGGGTGRQDVTGGAGGLLPGPRSEVIEGVPPGPGRVARLPGWVWGALGGALAVTLAGAGLAYAGVLPQHRPAPDLHGYRLGQSPCGAHTFDALSSAVAPRSSGVWPAVFEHTPQLDRAQCVFLANDARTRGGTTSYDLQVEVDLHRRTDPAPEFDAERSVDPSTLKVATRTTTTPHLGDRAYLLEFDTPTRILKVRSGGAVVTLRLEATTTPYGTGPDTEAPDLPDLGRLTPALTDAARAILTTLAA